MCSLRNVLRKEVGAEHGRDEPPFEHERRALGELLVVERLGVGRGLTPALTDVGHDVHQQHVARVLHAERGAERPHERHRRPHELDGLDPHAAPPSTT